MRHRKKLKKLGRPTAHRIAMLKNQVNDLFLSGSITTTEAKARETRRMAEKTLTIAKEGTLDAKRRVRKVINDPDAFQMIFNEYVPKYATRPGGYVKIIKLPPRRGDAAKMAMLAFVEEND
ncbi:MAG: 50S ribosomal protein L17 [bacterium]